MPMPRSLREPQNAVPLDQVAISLERRLGLFAEQDADLAARADVVVANHVVRIAMPDGDAVALVPFDEFFSARPQRTPQHQKSP